MTGDARRDRSSNLSEQPLRPPRPAWGASMKTAGGLESSGSSHTAAAAVPEQVDNTPLLPAGVSWAKKEPAAASISNPSSGWSRGRGVEGEETTGFRRPPAATGDGVSRPGPAIGFKPTSGFAAAPPGAKKQASAEANVWARGSKGETP